jgi:hypothetical protein
MTEKTFILLDANLNSNFYGFDWHISVIYSTTSLDRKIDKKRMNNHQQIFHFHKLLLIEIDSNCLNWMACWMKYEQKIQTERDK